MNTRLTRTLTIAGLAAAVTVAATVAAVASTSREEMIPHMRGWLPDHMQQLTDDQWTEMGRLMDEGDHAAMREWMDDQGLSVDRMHGDPAHDAMDVDAMRGGMGGGPRSPAATSRASAPAS